VPTGVVYGFLGPNGAGKTTTMRVLTGLIHADGGTVEILGKPFKRGDRHRLFEVGALVESPTFYPYLSARANLRELAASGAPVPSKRIEELLDLVGLCDRANDKVQGYSMGMKQRLGIAAALLSDPKLLLLDEPANGLDPAGIVAMRDTLKALAAQGKTVFVSSHLLGEIQVMADVVGIIASGKLVREGPLKELLSMQGVVKVRVRPNLVDAAIKTLAPSRRRNGSPRPIATRAGWPSVPRPTAPRRSTRSWPERASSPRAWSPARPRDALPRAHRRPGLSGEGTFVGLGARPTAADAAHGGKGNGGMRLFFSGLRKLVRRPATWVTVGC
jgi:ABC-type multidrug transport system ATPase subunit